MRRNIAKWGSGILAGIVLLLITSYLKGEQLPGASRLISKIQTGFPIIMSGVLFFAKSKSLVFIYGAVFGVFACKVIATFTRVEDKVENKYLDLSKKLDLLANKLAEYETSRMFMDIAEINKIEYICGLVFDELKLLLVVSQKVPDFRNSSSWPVQQVRNYLTKVSICLRFGEIEKANKVQFPPDE